VAVLADDYTVIGIDMRGHGRSSKPPGPYGIPVFALDVVHVLETLGHGPAHVVGLSMGGMIGFQLAVDAPSLVRSLVVVNSAPSVVPRTLREHALLTTRKLALRTLGLRRFGERIARANFPRPEQHAEREALAKRIASNDLAAYRASTNAIIGWSVEDRICSIACPVLIVSGDQDYTPVSYKRAYAAKIPGARVAVVERSRHVTPIDQTEAFNRILVDFLDEQGVRSQTMRAASPVAS
jgi:pimeloyl-ACP methyl ester carboxylesterase